MACSTDAGAAPASDAALATDLGAQLIAANADYERACFGFLSEAVHALVDTREPQWWQRVAVLVRDYQALLARGTQWPRHRVAVTGCCWLLELRASPWWPQP